jgi:large subunit ribosomal protein L9
MDVLLLEDIYKLGRAGDIKSVANGHARNFLIPQGMALPATPSAVLQAERIAAEADKQRNALNDELASVAKNIEEVQLQFPARAGETGKLYGSVTMQMIADQLAEKSGLEVDKRQIHGQPLRLLGMHNVGVRLTIDLIPEFSVVIFREGENPANYMIDAEELAAQTSELVEEQSEVAESTEAVAVDEAAEAVVEDETPEADVVEEAKGEDEAEGA